MTPPRPSSATAPLALRHVGKTHGEGPTAVHAVRDVSLTVEAGEFVVIMGPSGSGKSTLLTLAGGLDTASEGTVEVEGADLSRLSEDDLCAHRRRHIGFVFQDYNLIPTLTALENVCLPDELDGLPRARAREAGRQALARVGLGDLADRYPAEMSGGQQQRVAIARALGGGRRLLLADEPTGALDSHTAAEVIDLIRAQVAGGAAAVVVTHDPAVAGRAHRVVRLRDGALDLAPGTAPGPAPHPSTGEADVTVARAIRPARS